jgi:hypothetical protein
MTASPSNDSGQAEPGGAPAQPQALHRAVGVTTALGVTVTTTAPSSSHRVFVSVRSFVHSPFVGLDSLVASKRSADGYPISVGSGTRLLTCGSRRRALAVMGAKRNWLRP